MSEVVHVGSGKVRELYAIDDERLLLTASDRISVFDVVLPTEIPDKGRVLTGLSGYWFARTKEIVPNHLLGDPRRRTVDGVQAPRDAADRVRRPRLPLRLRLEELPRARRGLRHPASRGPARVGQAPGADLHAHDEGDRGPRRGAHAGAGCRARRPGALRRAPADLDRALRDGGRGTPRQGDHHRRHEVRARPRRGGPDRPRRRDLHARLVALLARGRVHARRVAALVRQAVRPRLRGVARLGQDAARARSCPTTSSRARAPAISRRSSRSPGLSFDDYAADPSRVLQ